MKASGRELVAPRTGLELREEPLARDPIGETEGAFQPGKRASSPSSSPSSAPRVVMAARAAARIEASSAAVRRERAHASIARLTSA